MYCAYESIVPFQLYKVCTIFNAFQFNRIGKELKISDMHICTYVRMNAYNTIHMYTNIFTYIYDALRILFPGANI